MKVNQKKLDDDNKVLLEVVASPEEVAKVLDAAHISFAQSMGMRPEKDKTVAQAAEEQMGIKDLDSIVKEQAIAGLVAPAVDKKNLSPAFLPQPEPKSPFKRGEEFRFNLEVELKPNYELTSYEPVSFDAPKFTFDETIVDKQIAEMAKRYTNYVKDEDVDPDRVIESGDNIKISLEAKQDGKIMEGLSTDGRTYSVGQGFMPPDFDKAIIGMKVGETKEFTFEGPGFDDDMNEITETVDAKVTVLELQKETTPEIDDEWVKMNLPMMGDLETFRNSVRKDLEKEARSQYDNFMRQQAAAEIAKRFEGSIPDEVYESSRESIIDNIRMQLKQDGKTWESFLEENGGEQQFGMMLMLHIREMLVQGFAMDAIFRHENLTLSDEDIEATCLALNPRMNPKKMREQMMQAGQGFALRESAERLKANNYLVEHANINYVEPENQ